MIINGSAFDVPVELIAQCDDLVCDPPYPDRVQANPMSTHTLDSGGPRARDFGFASLTEELRACIARAACAVKRWSVIFCSHEDTHKWRDAVGLGAEYLRETPHLWESAEYCHEAPWERWSQPQISGDRPPSGSEAVLHFHAQRVGARGGVKPIAKRWNGPGNLISYRERCLRGDDKYSAEKPLDLMLTIVSAFSDPGEIVLDLCAGVGTTILAARLLGRQGVGYEIDPRAAARAAEREEEPLSNRDRARAVEWCAGVEAEAVLIPDPRSLRRNPRHSDEQHAAKQRSMTATWERAQRRLEDKERVRQWL